MKTTSELDELTSAYWVQRALYFEVNAGDVADERSTFCTVDERVNKRGLAWGSGPIERMRMGEAYQSGREHVI